MPEAWKCNYWAHPSLLRSTAHSAHHTGPRTSKAVSLSFPMFANQPPLPFAWEAVISLSYLHCPYTRTEDYVGGSRPWKRACS